MNAGIGAGHHREADVAGPAMPDEVGAPSRVGPHLHRSAHQRRVVPDTVPDSDLGGELADSLVEHGHVIGDVVRPSVARAAALFSECT